MIPKAIEAQFQQTQLEALEIKGHPVSTPDTPGKHENDHCITTAGRGIVSKGQKMENPQIIVKIVTLLLQP